MGAAFGLHEAVSARQAINKGMTNFRITGTSVVPGKIPDPSRPVVNMICLRFHIIDDRYLMDVPRQIDPFCDEL